MAYEYLNPGSDALETAANWRLSDGTAGSGFTAASSTLFIENGGQNINPAGVDLSATVTTSVPSFTVRNFDGNIGSASGSVKWGGGSGTTYTGLDPVDRIDYFANRGNFYFEAKGGSGSADTLNLLRIGGGGNFFATGGAFLKVHVNGGSFNMNAIATFAASSTLQLFSGKAVIESSADVCESIECWGGSGTFKRNATAIVVHGGDHIIEMPTGVLTTLTIHGGRVELRSTKANGATNPIVNFNLYGGQLDCRNLKRTTQITNATLGPGEIISHPGLRLPTGANLTILGGGPRGNVQLS